MVTENSQFREITALALPEEGEFKSKIQAINKFQQIVHSNLVKDQDYGIIPGTQKPTLLKPGAEKIAKLLGLADEYIVIDRQEDWIKPFFRYLIKCQLRHIASGLVVSEGLGECNSMEAKYRWRWVGERDLPKGIDKASLISQKRTGRNGGEWTVYRLENDDIYTQVNTILKMSKKRALVDAALSAGRLSNVFTQDVEDFDKPPATTPEVGQSKEDESSTSEHFCKVHNVPFFKKGQMRGYAHQIGDTSKWCNEKQEDNKKTVAELLKEDPEEEELFPEETPAKAPIPPGAIDSWGEVAAYAYKAGIEPKAIIAAASPLLMGAKIVSWVSLGNAWEKMPDEWKASPESKGTPFAFAVAIVDRLKAGK